MSRPRIYSNELRKKACTMRRQGYDAKAISIYLGINIGTLSYIFYPEIRKVAYAKYYKKNRKRIISKMKEYVRKRKNTSVQLHCGTDKGQQG